MSGRKYAGPGSPTHGLSSTYRSTAYKCRCQPCRDANYAMQVRMNEQRSQGLATDPTLAKHGTVSTYQNWGCRCDRCRAAMSVKNREARDRRKAAREAS